MGWSRRMRPRRSHILPAEGLVGGYKGLISLGHPCCLWCCQYYSYHMGLSPHGTRLLLLLDMTCFRCSSYLTLRFLFFFFLNSSTYSRSLLACAARSIVSLECVHSWLLGVLDLAPSGTELCWVLDWIHPRFGRFTETITSDADAILLVVFLAFVESSLQALPSAGWGLSWGRYGAAAWYWFL